MGTLKVTIGVGDPQGRQFEELDVTVDTGSTYTAVPRAMLQRLGIPVERSLPSETADGRIVPVDVGEATIRLQGLQFHTPVIFAEENEPSPLGAVSLGQAALAVDPLAGRLIPSPRTSIPCPPASRIRSRQARTHQNDGPLRRQAGGPDRTSPLTNR